jgi:Fic family protein
MPRVTGTYSITAAAGERVRAFVPHPLPPARPRLVLDDEMRAQLRKAEVALQRLSVAAALVPSADWFLYGFVRKEAVITSQIEGTQATLRDVLEFEATDSADNPDDVQEVCSYVSALNYSRSQLASARGLPLSVRLLCEAHRRLMKGTRGADKQPGQLRRSQNWIGGTRPGNARFVPPPPNRVSETMAALEHWIHAGDALPSLIRVGLAHVQFETIHPFLDGNGRIGRLLIALLIEHWRLLDAPVLYLSLALKRRQMEYYERLNAVRAQGDWEGWTRFFLECVDEAAQDGEGVARKLFELTSLHRAKLLREGSVTVASLRLFEQLPTHPIMTLPRAISMLDVSKPTTTKAIAKLHAAGILRETTGKKRDRMYAYHDYLRILTGGAG